MTDDATEVDLLLLDSLSDEVKSVEVDLVAKHVC